jgi:tetratricopeptide (TPR) repeat protein
MRQTDPFEVARKDPPIGLETRMAAGQLAETRGNRAAAAKQYREALKVDPKYAPAMYRLGVVYAEMKRFPEALDLWKRYVTATGYSAAAYSNLGFCYELMGNTKEAEQAYQKGVAKDPSNVPCRVNYGLLLVRKGRVGEGKVQFSAVLQPAEVYYNVGSVYEATGRKEQAKAEYRTALKVDPQFADAVARLNELECGPTQAPTRTPTPTTVQPPAPPTVTATTQPVNAEESNQAATDGAPLSTE